MKNDIELSVYSEEQLPIKMAEEAIRQLVKEKRLALLDTHPLGEQSEQIKVLKLYEEQWKIACVKLSYDSYRRPVCFVVPPQLLAASLVYMSEQLLLRLTLFNRKQHDACMTQMNNNRRRKQGNGTDEAILGFKSPNNGQQQASVSDKVSG